MTLDLLSCTPAEDQCAGGLTVFLILYGAVVIIALLAFVLNKEVPNQLKGFVFYAQVFFNPFLNMYHCLVTAVVNDFTIVNHYTVPMQLACLVFRRRNSLVY